MNREAELAALTSQVARLFFDRQLSKTEIAARLGISRFRVARLIEQALARGLVRIEFRDVPPQDRVVARTIEEHWGVDLCVVSRNQGSGLDPLASLARLAGSVIGDLIGEGSVVGIAWGSTLAAVVDEIPRRDDPSIAVVQLAGSSTRLPRDRTPGELARRLADRLGGTYHALFAPAFVESKELRDALCRQPEIRETLAWFGRLDLAIIGIGAYVEGQQPRSSLLQAGVLSERDVEAMRRAGAIGDIGLLPFDREGRFVAPELMDRAIGISADELRGVPCVVAVAGGAEKAEAIAAALQTGIIDVLVTDDTAADQLVALAPIRSSGAPRRARGMRLPPPAVVPAPAPGAAGEVLEVAPARPVGPTAESPSARRSRR